MLSSAESTTEIPCAQPRTSERVAVIGSGIAGCLAAQALAQCGYRVQIFEERPEPFSGTSATAVQAHLGGLYSGSTQTARECLDSAVKIKKTMPYALNNREAMFLVAERSDIDVDSYLAFYEDLAGYYESLPSEDHVFGRPDDFFRIASADEYGFAKGIAGGIITKEPGLDMISTKNVLLGRLASFGVRILVDSEVVGVQTKSHGRFMLSVQNKDRVNNHIFDQVVNAGGYKCRVLDHELGDRTQYNLSLEAKAILRDVTNAAPLPPFYVVRGHFMHLTPVDNHGLVCLNTATRDGGYVDTATYQANSVGLPESWHRIMTTGILPDATARQRSMIEYANDNFLINRHFEQVDLIPGVSTSFSSSRQNRTQKSVSVIIPGWQTIIPTKVTHALGLAHQVADNALGHSMGA